MKEVEGLELGEVLLRISVLKRETLDAAIPLPSPSETLPKNLVTGPPGVRVHPYFAPFQVAQAIVPRST